MVNYIKYLILICIISIFESCSNYNTKVNSFKKTQKANVKLYLAELGIVKGCQAILIINDTDYYIIQAKFDNFKRYKFKEISKLLNDTIINNVHHLQFKNRIYCALVDSVYFDVKKDILLDTVIVQKQDLGYITRLTFHDSIIEFQSYYCFDKITTVNTIIDSSHIIAINYIWQFLERNKIESNINPKEIILGSLKKSNNRAYLYDSNSSSKLFIMSKILYPEN